MKKIYSIIMLAVTMLTLASTQAFAGTYSAKVVALAAPTGAGKVYVATSKTSNPGYGETSEAQGTQKTNNSSSAVITFYAYAQPEFGNKFVGWYENAEMTGSPVSTVAKEYEYAVTTSSDSNNPLVKNIYAKFDKAQNTLLMDDYYKVSGVVSLAEGLNEALVPAAFKKYLENEGNYSASAVITGEDKENELKITNNSEGLLNGFVIKGDQIQFSPENTFQIDGKTFSVVKADDVTVNTGLLDITATEGEKTYTINDLAVVYKEKVIGYVKNIKIEFDATPVNSVQAENSKKSVAKYVKNGKLIIVGGNKKYSVDGIEQK